MATPLPIRKHDKEGNIAVRDGLLFVLFLRKAHHEIAAGVGKLLDLYLGMVGKELTLILHRGDDYQPLTPKRLSSVRAKLTPAAQPGSELRFYLRSGEELACPEHLFLYDGIKAIDEEKASFVEIWLPTDFPEKVGMPAFVKALLELASTVPFCSGYCSLAVNYEDWAELPAQPLVLSIAARYPGIDIHDSTITSMFMRDGVRGAYWLTLLGREPLARLGKDAAALRAELGKKIIVHDLPGGVAIQAGDRPEPGDVNRQDRLPLVRKVAEVIEPVRVVQEVAVLFGDGNEYFEWQRRHLT